MGRIDYTVPADPASAGRPMLKRESGTLIWREPGRDGQPTVVKLYRRRGLASVLRSTATRFRTEREHRRLEHLIRAGVPTTEPVGWARGYSRDHGFHEVLITLELSRAAALDDFLEGQPNPDAASLAHLYRSVRRMHESGFCHQALYASNVLVSQDAPPEHRYFIIDVPRSWTFPGSIVGSDMASLDLLDLTWTIEQAGVAIDSIPVQAYGREGVTDRWWEGDRAAAMRRAGEARTKRIRARRDIAARLRWAAAWSLRTLPPRAKPGPNP